MFESFSDRISGIFDRLKRSGALKESDVDAALREIRIALLEADVSLEVAKKFIADVRERAVGQNIIRSVSPGQMVTKIVYDHLIELLGTSGETSIAAKPHKIMLAGLQGAGKTTTAGKLAKFLTKKGKKIVLASTDIHRPAAIEQLRTLSRQIPGAIFANADDGESLPSPYEIAHRALEVTESTNADILILDTAGRLHIDDIRMDELAQTQQIICPQETLLVVDIMTGQDAINIAKKFSESIDISGIVLTRVDGDARGGVALSMRAVTGCPLKFLGTGELLENLEPFDPERIAGRLLGMGDVVALVERAQENFSEHEAEEAARKMQQGIFTLDDMADQMGKMQKMGGLKSLLKMLPQSREINEAMETFGISDKTILRNIAIIRSMTKKERKNYKLLNGSRRRRIAIGSGTTVQEVNKLIKQYESTLGLYKKVKKTGGLEKFMSMIR
ncbi:MAG: signal recognition particle protein [Holosporaceae bacterium]|jgi:signal recognition particle subunit SRP54|nr:signal recognition particle protein [Holosporaceae bacterium]